MPIFWIFSSIHGLGVRGSIHMNSCWNMHAVFSSAFPPEAYTDCWFADCTIFICVVSKWRVQRTYNRFLSVYLKILYLDHRLNSDIQLHIA